MTDNDMSGIKEKSVGACLRRAREAKGLKLDEAARIAEELDAFARGELARLVLARDALQPAASLCLLFQAVEEGPARIGIEGPVHGALRAEVGLRAGCVTGAPSTRRASRRGRLRAAR